jgi:hypothetical protein
MKIDKMKIDKIKTRQKYIEKRMQKLKTNKWKYSKTHLFYLKKRKKEKRK